METLSQPEESLGQQTIEEQESAPEIMEQQPLEEDQPLEVLSQPNNHPIRHTTAETAT
jgi:hypothetical protein